MAKITGLFIDVANEHVQVKTVEKELDSYYEMLNCRCIDIVSRTIGGKPFDIVCDDEALLVDNPKISAISAGMEPMLVGNLFIVKFDGVEDITSLDQADIEHIENYIRKLGTSRHPMGYWMVTGVGY